MILDIVNIFLDLLPELILGAGPFCVFKGMGTGKDSGKLLFKKIYSDGGLTITEDSTSLDLTAVGGSSAINSCEIAFGDGVGGLTSSTFKVSESDKTIYGVSILGGNNKSNCSGVSGNESSIIVGGYNNRIDQKSEKSVIIGGKTNCLFNGLDDSFITLSQYSTVIIGGENNAIISEQGSPQSKDSSIIGSRYSYLKAYSSTSIGSYNSIIYGKIGEHSRSFTSGKTPYIGGVTYNTAVIAGSGKGGGINSSKNGKVEESLVIGSGTITVKSNIDSKSITVIGYKNVVNSSVNSSIIQGKVNSLSNSNSSTILNGYKNYMCNNGESGFFNYNSSILNGKYNCIKHYINPKLPNPTYYKSNFNSIIVNGYSNCIVGDDSNAILNGKYNCIVGGKTVNFPCNNTIINGNNNRITGNSVNSMIISGERIQIIGSRNSIAFSAGKFGNNYFKQIRGENNSLFQIFINYNISRPGDPYILGKNNFAMSVGRYTVAGGVEFLYTSKNTKNSSVLSLGRGDTTTIKGTVSNSAIIGNSSIVYYTNVTTLPQSPITENSVIISQNSSLINACNSNILGGKSNSIKVACDSVIVGGYSNRIDGFTISNSLNQPTFCISKRSVILGGHNNLIFEKGTVRGSIIIGGSFSCMCSDKVLLPNLDSCDKFSVYSSGVKYDGCTGAKSSISSITVCNGILIDWT